MLRSARTPRAASCRSISASSSLASQAAGKATAPGMWPPRASPLSRQPLKAAVGRRSTIVRSGSPRRSRSSSVDIAVPVGSWSGCSECHEDAVPSVVVTVRWAKEKPPPSRGPGECRAPTVSVSAQVHHLPCSAQVWHIQWVGVPGAHESGILTSLASLGKTRDSRRVDGRRAPPRARSRDAAPRTPATGATPQRERGARPASGAARPGPVMARSRPTSAAGNASGCRSARIAM